MALLELKNVSLSFDGKKIINNLFAEFWEGHVHAIVGPNGAGKSTLSSIIMGLDGYRHIEGEIIFKNRAITEERIDQRAKKGITLAWQEPARYEGLSVDKFIMAAAHTKTSGEVNRVLHLVGLDPESYRSRAVDKTLSGGERKKIELASILAMRPTLVMLDEPDSGIDVASLDKIFEAIAILKAQGTTVLLITHSVAVLNHAEHAFLLCHGEIIDKGPIEKMKKYFETKCIACEHKNKPDVEEKAAA